MKKLILILIAFSFSGLDLFAQDVPIRQGGNGTMWRDIQSDRGTTSGIFGDQGHWSNDLTISEKTPSQAASSFAYGVVHAGMGAVGWGSFSAGAYNRASGCGAVAIGFHNAAGPINNAIDLNGDDIGQTAFGYGTQATGSASFSAGEGTVASGKFSTVFGKTTTASGQNSTSIGFTTTASDFASLVMGQYNSSGSSVTSDATSFSTSNTAFVIGNGSDDSNRSDAFKVMFNGDATVSNDLTVSGDVVVSSDARLKANIASLGSTIAKLLLIDGKSYTMKKDGKQKIGVLAQDVQKVFPELVTKDGNEMLAVNYQGLVPVLINALKEQDEKISRLENLVEKLISEK